MISWFSCVPFELSPCSLDVLCYIRGELAIGKEKSTGLLSSCPAVSANVKLSLSGGASVLTCSLAVGASSLVLINTPLFFWFRGPLLTPVSKSGDVKGTSSSASQFPFTPSQTLAVAVPTLSILA